MNRELISELYSKAVEHCVALGPNPDGTNTAWGAWEWEEKFAELIVNACLQTIKDQSMDSGDDWESGLRIAEIAVKEHFGI